MNNGLKRRIRLKLARLNGTHTDLEWQQLKAEFGNRCVICGASGRNLERDHIIPLYKVRRSSDSIANIQPACAWCNSSKGSNETNWKEYRRLNGFGPCREQLFPPQDCLVTSLVTRALTRVVTIDKSESEFIRASGPSSHTQPAILFDLSCHSVAQGNELMI